jgi:EAL domain-containing protein (putative c-di-GMP-specific phosphodiesterase class I)
LRRSSAAENSFVTQPQAARNRSVERWPSTADARPFLELCVEKGGPVQKVPLLKVPFVIGRSETADHTIYSNTISKEHAVIVMTDGRYAVRDLQSTNGTFVNGAPTVEQVLVDGDIVHLAQIEFCFRHPAARMSAATLAGGEEVERTQAMSAGQPDSTIRGTLLLREMIGREAVEVVYQPVVTLATREVVGYEALGRGMHAGLSRDPEPLLRLADQCGLSVELSELFRRVAIGSSPRLPARSRLFLNVHPRELEGDRLVTTLSSLVEMPAAAGHPLVIEIAESSVTDVGAMATFKHECARLGVEFAYDDFGAGQARLLELTDIPPDYLKLDRAMIADIESAKPRREMVRAMLRVVRRLGVRTIAEGIESETVARICEQLGCDLGQGFLFGAEL